MNVRRVALVVAAGVGARMGASLPKQYRQLAGRPLLAHSLTVLTAHADIDAVYVVLAPNDTDWESFAVRGEWGRAQPLFCGGETRARSVANGLRILQDLAGLSEQDWVLVHDGARPCLDTVQLGRLIGKVTDDPVGGILAVPVADTLKRGDEDRRIVATVARDHLWVAQTPQMFRFGVLRRALAMTLDVSDEAAAVEALGMKPLLVPSDPSNLKVTWPADLLLAELILRAREGSACCA